MTGSIANNDILGNLVGFIISYVLEVIEDRPIKLVNIHPNLLVTIITSRLLNF